MLIIYYLHKTFFIVLVVKGLGSHFSFDVVVVATHYCCVVDYHLFRLIIISLEFYIFMAMNIKFSLDDNVIEFELC
jgi:hypothetical protein